MEGPLSPRQQDERATADLLERAVAAQGAVGEALVGRFALRTGLPLADAEAEVERLRALG